MTAGHTNGGHALAEFHYKLPQRIGSQRPGAHAGSSLGAGLQFAAHRRLLDHPDPRRIDLRASLRDVRGDWLVRIARQRAAVPVHALVDVSASMHFGTPRSKLDVVADFAEALGHSAFRAGDPVGLLGFDTAERDDLFLPARHGRGLGGLMAALLRDCRAATTASSKPSARSRSALTSDGMPAGLRHSLSRLAGRPGLVFWVSDFHGIGRAALSDTLDLLAPASVVPMIAWDAAETEPPNDDALLSVRDAESGARRALWVREPLRRQWRDAVAARRAELQALFESRGLPPFALLNPHGRFDAEALTRYFMETVA